MRSTAGRRQQPSVCPCPSAEGTTGTRPSQEQLLPGAGALRAEMRARAQPGTTSDPTSSDDREARQDGFYRDNRITESQHGRGWKGPLWVIQSNPPAEAGSPTVGCRGDLTDQAHPTATLWSTERFVSHHTDLPSPFSGSSRQPFFSRFSR